MIDQRREALVDAYVDEVWEDVVNDIRTLVSMNSVSDAAAAVPGAPFGRPVRAALDAGLGIARRLGFETSDDEGYVGVADICGERAAQIATIAHLDVVPAGPGWHTDPFAMERREGWLLGRGVIDDKGPAVLSLYAGAYFIRQGIKPRYTFRALLGCDEEVGMRDVAHYLGSHDDPAFLFTPDASFPVCNAEKGNFDATFASAEIEDGRILSWSGAEAGNAIPSESIVELAIDSADMPTPAVHAERFEIEPVRPGVTRVTAHGIGGHASLPAGTLNAIGLIVGYLRDFDLCGRDEAAFLTLLSLVLADTDGRMLGIDSRNEAFGALTVNGGTIEVRDRRILQTIDIRYPDSIDAATLDERLSAIAAQHNATLSVDSVKVPFSIAADAPTVRTLINVYEHVTGERAEPFSMGGGTYARKFKRAVSFGPEDDRIELPSWVGTMHGPDEGASEVQLRKALKIYLLALTELMELDL